MSLFSPQELKAAYPLSSRARTFVEKSRMSARNVLLGREKRLLIIAGPCSIHDLDSAHLYADRFATLIKKVEKQCILLMRTYVEKPRTTVGWKGFLYDPYLNGTSAIAIGLKWTRQLFVELAEREIPTATEFLEPIAAPFFEDLVTWGFIGARTASSQIHRQLASLLSIPIGFKNSVSGYLDDAINGMIAAKHPHTFLHLSDEGKICVATSRGNPFSHLVLRGSETSTNCDAASISALQTRLRQMLLSPRILVDCSHGNCQKDYEKQRESFIGIMRQIQEGNSQIIGLMLESHLQKGNQPLSASASKDISVTDPCLDWASTEELILSASACCKSS